MRYKHQKYFSSAILFVSLLSISSLATAGLNGGGILIAYQPAVAASIPTLGGFGLVMLTLLLAVVAVRMIKNQQNSGTTWLLTAICVTALATGSSGIKLISDAYAMYNTEYMTSDSGGTVTVGSLGCTHVFNDTSVTQEIINIDSGEYFVGSCANGGSSANGGSYRGTCSDNPSTSLNVDDYCEIQVYPPV